MRAVTHPPVALGILSAALVVLHLRWAVDLALRVPVAHDAELQSVTIRFLLRSLRTS